MGRRLQDLSPDGTRINVNAPPHPLPHSGIESGSEGNDPPAQDRFDDFKTVNVSRNQNQTINTYTPTRPLVADLTPMISVGTSVADAPWPMPPVDVVINHPVDIADSTCAFVEATVAAADAMQSHTIWRAEHHVTPPIRAAGESIIGAEYASRMIQQAAALEDGSTWYEWLQSRGNVGDGNLTSGRADELSSVKEVSSLEEGSKDGKTEEAINPFRVGDGSEKLVEAAQTDATWEEVDRFEIDNSVDSERG